MSSINIDLPQSILSGDPKEIYRYIFSLTEQLSYKFNDITKELEEIKKQIAELKEGNNV